MVRSRSNLDEFNKIEINFDRILIIRKGGGGRENGGCWLSTSQLLIWHNMALETYNITE